MDNAKYLKQLLMEKLAESASIVSSIELEVPKNSQLGDFAFPCFLLAKEKKKSPIEIAKETANLISQSLSNDKIIKKVEAQGPYVNFFVDKSGAINDSLKNAIKEGESFGSSYLGEGKKALIEHTSVNPNASPHLGRARNAMIGDSIARMLKFQKFQTEVHYFVNDVGKQIAMLVIGCEGKKNVTFNDLLQIYIDVSKLAEENPEMENQIFSLLHKLEEGDRETKEKFDQVVGICIEGQRAILHEFGIDYDSFDHESKYLLSKRTDEILSKFEKLGKLFTDEQNRKVLDLKGFDVPMESPVFVLTRNDGTSLYQLRDIAYHIEKLDKSENNYVVLGEDHKLYFHQLTAALKLLGYGAPKALHYSFILLNEGKMSTRKGNVVLLEDFMNEAKEKALLEIKKRHGETQNANELAKMIAYGAVKYSILKVSAEKNVMFDWESALNFEGESAPYIQYSHARIASIFAKLKSEGLSLPDEKDVDFSNLKDESEIALAMKIADFPTVAKKAFSDLRPHIVANYANELAQKFNDFYHNCPILQADEKTKNARLLLCVVCKQTLKNALWLLGIDAPERM